MASDGKLLHVEIGPVGIDVPQTVGYFGGLGLAVAIGLIEPPLGAFIAAVPIFKILADRGNPTPVRFVSEILLGAAKPVGSDAEGTVQLSDPGRERREAGAVRTAAQPAARGRRSG